jgi:hypothetical protein
MAFEFLPGANIPQLTGYTSGPSSPPSKQEATSQQVAERKPCAFNIDEICRMMTGSQEADRRIAPAQDLRKPPAALELNGSNRDGSIPALLRLVEEPAHAAPSGGEQARAPGVTQATKYGDYDQWNSRLANGLLSFMDDAAPCPALQGPSQAFTLPGNAEFSSHFEHF